MAKIKLTKGKASVSKRNVARSIKTCCVYLNLAATIFIILKMYKVINI